jgi:predicted nucleic acid-binding protein
MILVDSSVWINYFNGVINPKTDVLDRLLNEEIISIGDLIYTEVLQGFKKEKDFKQAKKLFDGLLFFEMLGKEQSVNTIKNFRFLRSKGITIRKTIDMIIATFCICNNLQLLHNDKDFDLIAKNLNLNIYE